MPKEEPELGAAEIMRLEAEEAKKRAKNAKKRRSRAKKTGKWA